MLLNYTDFYECVNTYTQFKRGMRSFKEVKRVTIRAELKIINIPK